MNERTPVLSISIVSHGQSALVENLLRDIGRYCADSDLEVILTLNIPESPTFDPGHFDFPLQVLRNPQAKGFGQNHNAAFRLARGRFFCVLNPDIRLQGDPFGTLLSAFDDPAVGVAAPLIVDEHGKREDSARSFPTPTELVGKLFGGRSAVFNESGKAGDAPDWLAGMFMVFPQRIFRQLGGFDERYFLYYEDVDICMRSRLLGYRAHLCGNVSAVHFARRSSHRNPRYLYWHVSSVLRYLLSSPYRKIRQERQG